MYYVRRGNVEKAGTVVNTILALFLASLRLAAAQNAPVTPRFLLHRPGQRDADDKPSLDRGKTCSILGRGRRVRGVTSPPSPTQSHHHRFLARTCCAPVSLICFFFLLHSFSLRGRAHG
ncbi:hypothetical protein HYQ46_000531 [Verticillium longisporum]|nr:hypothetical protein HYQ46_000531 [Verticillium longisporum]